MGNFQKFLFVVFLVIFLDLFTKELAVKLFADKDFTIIPNFFDFTLVWNKGAAFGVLSEAPLWIRKLILVFASLIAAVATIVYAYAKQNTLSKLELYSLALIAGGALGNLYDRIFLGQVRDFIDWHIFNYHWPAFNIADASITVGIFLFALNELYLKNRKKN
jgi:signal peptidase II